MLRIEDLHVEGRTPQGRWVPTVRGVDLTVEPGEVVALIGESGAGKTTVALAAMGHTRPGTRIAGGRVIFEGTDLLQGTLAERRKLWGRHVAYVAQSAQAALNPAISIGDQVQEPLLIHGLAQPAEARRRAIELLGRLDLSTPAALAKRYPHQVSGGQQQRIMVAMALTCDPRLLILDEPTTALDVTTQIEVLQAIKAILREQRSAAIYVSHDLAVVAQIADRILVMRAGQVVEEGTTAQIVGRPGTTYTRQLIAAFSPRRRASSGSTAAGRPPLLQIVGVSSAYGRASWFGGRGDAMNVLQDVSIDLGAREVVAIVGESGSGKSTLARVVAGLHAANAGEVRLDGRKRAMRARRRDREALRRIQIILQSPDLSLNPAQRVEQAIGRPLGLYFGASDRERRARVAELLTMVGLTPDYGGRFPAELSGGQRQRVSIARAFAARPDIVICDEILSSLDALVAAQILDLMRKLRAEHDVAYLFISHDLATVSSVADRVVVLYAGRVCEIGPTAAVFEPPHHPYTALLLSSVPPLRQGWLEEVGKNRSPAAQAGAPLFRDVGCPFRVRCPMAIPGRCEQAPPARPAGPGRIVYCHRELDELAAAQCESRARVRPDRAAASVME